MREVGAKDSVKGLEGARRGGKKEEARHEAYSHRGHFLSICKGNLEPGFG